MDPRHDMYIMSSQHGFSAEEESHLRSSSRILQHSSGNIGLECASTTTKIEGDEANDTKEAPSIFEPHRRPSDGDGRRSSARRTRRGRPYPWQTDRNFIRWERQSERYNAYRKKSRENTDQVWPEDLEDCLQYGKDILSDNHICSQRAKYYKHYG